MGDVPLMGGSLQELLGVRVDTRGRLVEDHQARVGQEDPGEGNQLGLAGGEALAGRSEVGVQAVGEPAEPGLQAEAHQHAVEAAVRHVAVEEGDVVPQAAMEQLHLLGHQADPSPELVEAGLADVDAAEADRAGGRVVQAEQEPRHGRLAGTGASDEADHFAG